MASKGRPKGLPKTGGRVAGTKNRKIEQKEAEIAASGLTPLDYMLTLLRDEGLDRETRLDAAKSAAPYCHARLQQSATTVTGTLGIEQLLSDLDGLGSGLPGAQPD